jgi:hypothetical protein
MSIAGRNLLEVWVDGHRDRGELKALNNMLSILLRKIRLDSYDLSRCRRSATQYAKICTTHFTSVAWDGRNGKVEKGRSVKRL